MAKTHVSDLDYLDIFSVMLLCGLIERKLLCLDEENLVFARGLLLFFVCLVSVLRCSQSSFLVLSNSWPTSSMHIY